MESKDLQDLHTHESSGIKTSTLYEYNPCFKLTLQTLLVVRKPVSNVGSVSSVKLGTGFKKINTVVLFI